jgi:predicted nucleic acid-binding Zn ribbon protein
MKKPYPIRSILENTLKGLEMDVPLKTYSIWRVWKEIVGESVALQTQPRAVRNRILFIDVSHPTWMQQLQFLKPTLLEKVNTFIGEPLIQDVRFKLGRISTTLSAPSKADMRVEKDLDEETLTRLEDLLHEISDREVKKSLWDLLVKSARLEQSRRKSK